MTTTFIYALNDPITGLTRYIGKADRPEKRLSGHLSDKRKCHRTSWIKNLTNQGLTPVLEIIDEVPCAEWPMWEVAYIQNFKELGHPLVNGTLGGEGGLGRNTGSPWNVGRIPWNKGIPATPEERKKTSSGVKKAWASYSPEDRKSKIELRSESSWGRKWKNASSKFLGVSFHSGARLWRASIFVEGKKLSLKYYSSEIDAAIAYDWAAKLYFGDKAKLNFPNENPIN